MKPRTVKHRLNARQRLVVVVMDVLLLAELAGCMFLASRTPELMAAQFLKTYVPLMLATVVGARLIMRRLRAEDEPARA